MRKVIYPGTFDPVTFGHIDIIRRAHELFDCVIVTIAKNPDKNRTLFTVEERLELLRESLKEFDNVQINSYDGLTIDHAKNSGAIGIIRGLRAVSDFEYEFQMALMNRKLDGGISSIFLMPDEKYTYLNSSIIKNLASYNADVSDFVPSNVADALKQKFGFAKNQ